MSSRLGPAWLNRAKGDRRADLRGPLRPLRGPGRPDQRAGAVAGEGVGRADHRPELRPPPAGPAGRIAEQPARRGLRPGPRGRQADPRHAALRRPDDGRHRHPPPLDRRDGDRRGQDPRLHLPGLPERPLRQGRPHRHGQRLPRPPRRRVERAGLPPARPDRRLHPDRPGRRDPPRRLCLRHHLRDRQGVRLRLPPRRAEAVPARRERPQDLHAGLPRHRDPGRDGEAGAAGPPFRDHRRGRQHPDRRGADPADHRGQQPADPGGDLGLLRGRRAGRDPGADQGLQVRPGRAEGRADRRRPPEGPGPAPASRPSRC